ncbi:hypothetical protein [Serratia fonticola]|uniref:hypothetical protein n=1 Tax=Serratia fonticola TaxID=47917 RepID=UPI0021AD7668|nr:hypothetical protein [Serratia fonticola]
MRYKSFYILPAMAKKTLSEHGWDFESKSRLPEHLESDLVIALNLSFIESYSGVNDYKGDGFKVTFIKDDDFHIENVYFRVYQSGFNDLVDLICSLFEKNDDIEIFVPSFK